MIWGMRWSALLKITLVIIVYSASAAGASIGIRLTGSRPAAFAAFFFVLWSGFGLVWLIASGTLSVPERGSIWLAYAGGCRRSGQRHRPRRRLSRLGHGQPGDRGHLPGHRWSASVKNRTGDGLGSAWRREDDAADKHPVTCFRVVASAWAVPLALALGTSGGSATLRELLALAKTKRERHSGRSRCRRLRWLEAQAGTGRHHRRSPRMDGRDDLLGVDALQVDAGRAEVGMPQLSLDDVERYALAG